MISIELFSDVICPWCYIGSRRLRQALEATKIPATIRYRPFLLDPDLPHGGADLRERLSRKYGGDPRRIFDRVEQAARSSGIPLDFDKVRRSYSTLAAQTVLRHAHGPAQVALADALFAAYFLDGNDIEDPVVLADLAAPHGLDPEETIALAIDPQEQAQTRAEAEAAQAQGIRAVPFTILDGRLAISGAQPLEVWKGALTQAVEEAPVSIV